MIAERLLERLAFPDQDTLIDENRRGRSVVVEPDRRQQVERSPQGRLGLQGVAVGEGRQPQPYVVEQDVGVITAGVFPQRLASSREVVPVVTVDRRVVALVRGAAQATRQDNARQESVRSAFVPARPLRPAG